MLYLDTVYMYVYSYLLQLQNVLYSFKPSDWELHKSVLIKKGQAQPFSIDRIKGYIEEYRVFVQIKSIKKQLSKGLAT